MFVGDDVGIFVGSLDGFIDGASDGILVGLNEGIFVGPTLGFLDGAFVGILDGCMLDYMLVILLELELNLDSSYPILSTNICIATLLNAKRYFRWIGCNKYN